GGRHRHWLERPKGRRCQSRSLHLWHAETPMIFIYSWAWIALADKDDPCHRKAKAEHKNLVRARQQYVTTDYILGETITYLYDAIRPALAQEFIKALLVAIDSGTYVLVHVSPQRFRA